MLSYVAFWIGTSVDQRSARVGDGSRVVFSASSWKAVDDLRAAPLANRELATEKRRRIGPVGQP